MNEARLFDMIFDPDTKRLANLGGNPDGFHRVAGCEAMEAILPLTSMSRRSIPQRASRCRPLARAAAMPRQSREFRQENYGGQHESLRYGLIADFLD